MKEWNGKKREMNNYNKNKNIDSWDNIFNNTERVNDCDESGY